LYPSLGPDNQPASLRVEECVSLNSTIMIQQLQSKAALAALLLAGCTGAALAADVGVSISISQPGVYGRVDIGQFPQPAVVMAQPMIMQPAPVYMGAAPQPVYLWVPPGHRKNWRHHCARYNACGVPVYFVREDWYRQHVAPVRQQRHEERRDERYEDGRGGHGHAPQGRGRDENRGHGHGHGHD
jgi:hypothetical protein